MAGETSYPLPFDVLEAQLSTVDLIVAMFPSTGELEISDSATQCIEFLQDWCASPEKSSPQTPANISFTVHLAIDDASHSIQFNISVPLQSPSVDPLEPPPLTYTLRQPSWMSKAEVMELSSLMPQDDIFSAFEHIREEAARFIKADVEDMKNDSKADGPIIRVWFYFPSLSTREKRDDLVNHAPEYRLTGFVLAGKPGVLCLEGTSTNVDAYMKFIKTNSWGDIPSYQKKVSERYREDGKANGTDGNGGGIKRVFDGMEEITDVLGERGGQRANRGDMKALEAWLKDKGLGDAFEKVIF
jgi:hypothetical protein